MLRVEFFLGCFFAISVCVFVYCVVVIIIETSRNQFVCLSCVRFFFYICLYSSYIDVCDRCIYLYLRPSFLIWMNLLWKKQFRPIRLRTTTSSSTKREKRERTFVRFGKYAVYVYIYRLITKTNPHSIHRIHICIYYIHCHL